MDTKLYDLDDMVKIGCNDCKGCFSCCQGMGQSIVLDPYDIWQLETHLNCTFAELMQEKLELHVTDGLILPNLMMQGNLERCGFLNEEGRCSIHSFRPGLCRLFPLGRNYEDHKLQYFLLEDACHHTNHTKSKVKKWLDIPYSRKYEGFLVTWHDLRKKLQKKIAEKAPASDTDTSPQAEQEWMLRAKEINRRLLSVFYEEPYMSRDFYGQFEERMASYMEAVPICRHRQERE